MKLPNRLHGLPVAALLLTAAPAFAQTDVRESGWYMGAGLGAARYSLDNSGFASTELGRAAGARGVSYGDSSATSGALKLYGGYDFNRYLGAEAALVSLGGVQTKYYSSQANGAQVATSDYYVGALTLAGVGRYEFDNGIVLKAKAGFAFTSATNDYSLAQPGGVLLTNDPSANKTNFYWGLSAGYLFTRHWGVMLDYENYGTVGSNSSTGEAKLQSLMASVQYRF